MTPWIVTISSGEYSDHTIVIDGAYETKEAAFERMCELAGTLMRVARWERPYMDNAKQGQEEVKIESGARFVRIVTNVVDSLHEVTFEATQLEPSRSIDDVLGAFHWHVKESDL